MAGARRTRAAHVLALLALANLLSYASRNVPFACYDDLRARFGVDDGDLGWLGTAFMLPHALATLPVGWLADRVDRRRVIAIGTVLWSLGGLAGALSPSYAGVVASRTLVGLGTAAVVPVANAVLGQLYAGSRKAFALAVFNLGLFIGGALGFVIGGGMVFPASWIAIAAPGFVVAIVIVSIDMPDAPPRPEAPASASMSMAAAEGWRRLRADTAVLLRIPTLRRIMYATTVMAFAAGGLLAWLKDFLEHDKHMTEQGATTLLAGCLAAGLCGVVTGGRVGDLLRRRWPWGRLGAIAIGMGLTVPCAITCILLPLGPALWLAAMATMFFVTWYHGPMAASVDDVAPAAQAASAQGVVISTMHLIGTAPSSLVIGQIYERAPRTAMLSATAMIAVAGVLVTRTFSTVAADAAAAAASGNRPGELL